MINGKALRSRDIVAVFVVSILIFIPFATLVLKMFPLSEAVVSNGGMIIGYGLMFVVIRHTASTFSISFSDVTKRPFARIFFPLAIAYAALLLAFTSGQNFIVVYLVAQYDPGFAYAHWNFHDVPYVLQITGWGYVALIVAQFVIAPFVEEFVFRGLLLKVWSDRWGVSTAVLLNAALFAALHLNRHYFLSTFVFGIVMCLLYIRYQSLWVNVLTHAVFNLMAFCYQFLFNFHWLKSLNELDRMSNWVPEIGMLLVSVPALSVLIIKSWPLSGLLKGRK